MRISRENYQLRGATRFANSLLLTFKLAFLCKSLPINNFKLCHQPRRATTKVREQPFNPLTLAPDKCNKICYGYQHVLGRESTSDNVAQLFILFYSRLSNRHSYNYSLCDHWNFYLLSCDAVFCLL